MRPRRITASAQLLPTTTLDRFHASPVFVVGCPRSGTTLLQRLLGQHARVAIAPETHFVRRFWAERRRYGDLRDDQRYAALLSDVVDIPAWPELGVDAAEFRHAAWRGPRNYADIFGLLLQLFADHHEATTVGEKTPNHVLAMPTLAAFFPRARFVHIVRDPRAVVDSWRTVPWSTGSVVGDAEVWRRYARSARHIATRGFPPLHQVRYEDLVTDPQGELRRIGDFLGLSLAGPAEEPSRRQPAVDIEREPWKARALQQVAEDRATRWVTSLSSLAVKEVEATVAPLLEAYGYAPTNTPRVLLSMRIQRLVVRVTRSARRIVRRVRR